MLLHTVEGGMIEPRPEPKLCQKKVEGIVHVTFKTPPLVPPHIQGLPQAASLKVNVQLGCPMHEGLLVHARGPPSGHDALFMHQTKSEP